MGCSHFEDISRCHFGDISRPAGIADLPMGDSTLLRLDLQSKWTHASCQERVWMGLVGEMWGGTHCWTTQKQEMRRNTESTPTAVYRWAPSNLNMDNPKSQLIPSFLEIIHCISRVFNCTLNSKFHQNGRIFTWYSCSDQAGPNFVFILFQDMFKARKLVALQRVSNEGNEEAFEAEISLSLAFTWSGVV